MRGKYQKLFDLAVFHEYYTNQPSSDFVFSPTTACKKMMIGHKLLFSQSSHGFRVDYPVLNDRPFIEIGKSALFSFVLNLKNTNLFNFTKIPQRSCYVHYFTNKKIVDADLELLTSGLVPSGKKCLHHYYASKEVIAERYIGTDQLLDHKKAFGYLSIHKSELKNEHNVISFQTDSKVWRYCVVLPKDSNQSDYIIQKERDLSNGGNNRYAPMTISFQKRDEKLWSGGRKILLFESSIANDKKRLKDAMSLPFYEEGLKNLQLVEKINKIDSGGKSVSDKVVIKHLPNPSIKNFKPEVFLYL